MCQSTESAQKTQNSIGFSTLILNMLSNIQGKKQEKLNASAELNNLNNIYSKACALFKDEIKLFIITFTNKKKTDV